MAKSALGVFLLSIAMCMGTSGSAIAATAQSTVKKSSAVKASATVSKKAAAKRPVAVRAKRSVTVSARGKTVRKVVLVGGKRKVVTQRVAYAPALRSAPQAMTAGDLAGLSATRDPLELKSNAALVLDQTTAQVLFEKNSNVALPIASITKLMTALVVVEAHQDMDELLEVTEEDIDKEKGSHSRLRVGSQLTRANMLHIALMSSENRAASALGRNYPGGLRAFVAAMNAKSRLLGMSDTRYVDSTGLSSSNVASARDLAKLVVAAYQYPLIREYSTNPNYVVDPGGRALLYRNSNQLVLNPAWEIGLQKTGYISEAGRCLVMQANIEGRPVVMVFLDSKGKQSRLADAGRIRKWLEGGVKPQAFSQGGNPRS